MMSRNQSHYSMMHPNMDGVLVSCKKHKSSPMRQGHVKFVKSWGIKVETSSPTYAQSNGYADRDVQTLKSSMKKADSEGSDPCIVMLEYRNTPISGLRYAPVQLAMSRLLRSKLPTSRSVLQPSAACRERET